MAFKIGFSAETERKSDKEFIPEASKSLTPKKSVVRVFFPQKSTTLSYYNNLFDLRVGDLVYVDGKLEGLQGRIVEVNYSFKIKLSDYKRVIALVDADVNGEFYIAGSHCVSFDRTALPFAKALLWFKAPAKEDEELVSGNDDFSFDLSDLSCMKLKPEVAQRGHEYYMENRVRYICIDGHKGHAIVRGSEVYEVQFDYHDGQISNLTCDCFCTYRCKHEFAAMLQLRETLEYIEKNYSSHYNDSNYFAAIDKADLFIYAIDSKETGSFSL